MGKKKGKPQSKVYMPPANDFIMFMLGASEAIYGGKWQIGPGTYDQIRPKGWPQSTTLCRHLGYPTNWEGWCEFVELMTGGKVIDRAAIGKLAGERRAFKVPEKLNLKGFSTADSLSYALNYAWPWDSARERLDAQQRGWQ